MDRTDYFYISHYKETDSEVWDTYVGILVTCKDCKHFNGEDTYCDFDHFCHSDSFCSYGERRE